MKGKTILVPTPPPPHSSYPLSAPRNMTFNTFVHPLEYPPLTPTSRRRGGGAAYYGQNPLPHLLYSPCHAFMRPSKNSHILSCFAHRVYLYLRALGRPHCLPPQIFRNLFCHYPFPTPPPTHGFGVGVGLAKKERAWVVSSLRCR